MTNMLKLIDNVCLWRKKLNFHFWKSLFSGIAHIICHFFHLFLKKSIERERRESFADLWRKKNFFFSCTNCKILARTAKKVNYINCVFKCSELSYADFFELFWLLFIYLFVYLLFCFSWSASKFWHLELHLQVFLFVFSFAHCGDSLEHLLD